jgi:subtilisin family serine protease
VCGTIAGGRTPDGVAIGVAPKAELLAGGVLIATGTLIALVEGLSWAVERGADVINMSLGFPAFEPYFTIVLDRIIDRYGILPVVSIGNENHGNSSSPGNSPAAFSVGAVGQGVRRSSLVVASFSSGASLQFPGEKRYPLITKPDVVAPGHGIYSAVPPQKIDGESFEYMYMSGTSMAAPHVAGVAALLMAAKPRAPVRDIMCALRETAWHPSGKSLRPDNRWGHGMIRPIEALKVL